jgi:hypothetical protein
MERNMSPLAVLLVIPESTCLILDLEMGFVESYHGLPQSLQAYIFCDRALK